ncbi:uncharacterized protein [Diadema setosum]|uniref:uncharacterized protein n=1 Tax=Diadema setosum TaxID=31175 RepID=UPI003B39FCB9
MASRTPQPSSSQPPPIEDFEAVSWDELPRDSSDKMRENATPDTGERTLMERGGHSRTQATLRYETEHSSTLFDPFPGALPEPEGQGEDLLLAGQSTSGASPSDVLIAEDGMNPMPAASPSCDSSLGDSRSPDVLWRDSCVSDMSETSSSGSANCSTTSPKDESNGSALTGHSSSGMNSDQEKQKKITQATFDKVLVDANQRRQIRNKARNTGTDSGSDSSSGNMDMRTVISTSANAMKLESTSDSSGIGANYPSSVQCDLELPGPSRPQLLQSGVTNSSTGVSTMYNSQGNKVSDESKQESMSSGSSGNRKRHIPWSIARHYYQTKRAAMSPEAQNAADEANSEFSSVGLKRPAQTDRKRKRFHRTFTALRQCGLLDLTMQTASLMEQNTKLQKQLSDLHRQAHVMYHTVTHFSKIQPNAFGTPEAKKVMDGLKAMVDKNPANMVDMSSFESTSRTSPAIDSGAFTLSNLPLSFVEGSTSSTFMNPGPVGSQETSTQRTSAENAIQSSGVSVSANSSTSSPKQ